eukprot:Pgem_evm2s10022
MPKDHQQGQEQGQEQEQEQEQEEEGEEEEKEEEEGDNNEQQQQQHHQQQQFQQEAQQSAKQKTIREKQKQRNRERFQPQTITNREQQIKIWLSQQEKQFSEVKELKDRPGYSIGGRESKAKYNEDVVINEAKSKDYIPYYCDVPCKFSEGKFSLVMNWPVANSSMIIRTSLEGSSHYSAIKNKAEPKENWLFF